jgi:hypothetical protein
VLGQLDPALNPAQEPRQRLTASVPSLAPEIGAVELMTGWHSQNREKLLAELRSEPVKAALTKAGFAQRNPAFVDLFILNFERMVAGVSW